MKKSLLILAAVLCATPSFAQWKTKKADPETTQMAAGIDRIQQVTGLIDKEYVDSPDLNRLSEKAVVAMLKDLDPHSVYIAAKDVERANEGLQGNFEGVGVSYQVVDDTISIVDVIVGGPSEKVGLQRGDKFITIDGIKATGDSINNNWVPKHLRGKKGTKVDLEILRGSELMKFTVVRDKVPIYSVDSYFMADDSIGYIRLTRFARTSVAEVRNAISVLSKQGMKALMLDLRGNGGGYLDIACGLANEFLPNHALIVYTEGRNSPRQNFNSNRFGSFRQGSLVVMIDESSASASEIVSGAIQDWDRGVIVGRRSFGKGLVQRMFELKDGAQVRLTTARYYTPSGRCIQKSYSEGTDSYLNDVNERYKHGELVNADSIHFADSLKYKTSKGRTVYGGGGIMPDVFVPMDTMRLTQYCVDLRSKGILNDWTSRWADSHREEYKNVPFAEFQKMYKDLGLAAQLEAYALEKGVVRDAEKEAAEPDRAKRSNAYIDEMLEALVAKGLYGSEYYYRVMKDYDDGYLAALKVIRGRK